MKKIKFRCCFCSCKYSSSSLIKIFEHLHQEHRVVTTKNYFKELSEVEE